MAAPSMPTSILSLSPPSFMHASMRAKLTTHGRPQHSHQRPQPVLHFTEGEAAATGGGYKRRPDGCSVGIGCGVGSGKDICAEARSLKERQLGPVMSLPHAHNPSTDCGAACEARSAGSRRRRGGATGWCCCEHGVQGAEDGQLRREERRCNERKNDLVGPMRAQARECKKSTAGDTA
eukprot:scaffold117199_cov21-Tisochrysis_lutea.AAC.1